MYATVPPGAEGHSEIAMTVFRLISLPVHGAAELALGLVTLIAPFVLGMGTAGTIVGVVAGALIVGLALSTLEETTVRVADHHAYDYAMLGAMGAAAVLLGAAGDRAAALYFAAATAAQLALNLTTRYSARV
jgi:hypothetical protein